MLEICAGFEARRGLPQVGGCIDGTHIPVQPPADQATAYFNHKGFHSMQAQIVCDHKFRIRNVFTGFPGRVHDARVFANSKVGQKCEAGTLFSAPSRKIQEVDVPVFLIADPAYPLSSCLMKPFSQGGLTREQEHFNFCLSSTRITVENTIGRLKTRWRLLSKNVQLYVGIVPEYIICCCVLHNLCEYRDEEMLSQWSRDCEKALSEQNVPLDPIIDFYGNGGLIRNVLAQYLNE